jgi:septal ring-binding cell division protein DamX
MSDALQSVADSQTSERRFHRRRRVLYSSMELEDDNGGIILNLSENGLAMQVVRSLADEPLPQMRFQVSQSNAWVEARGRIAWISPSKKTIGVEFVGLPYEERMVINRWISSIDHSSAAATETAPVEEIAPAVEPASTGVELASIASVPEPETTELVLANPEQDLVAKDPAGLPPIASETRDVETVSQYSQATVHPNTTTEETAPVEEIAPTEEPTSADVELASIASVPEPEMKELVLAIPEQELIAKDPAGLPPIASETRDVEPVWQYFRPMSRSTRPPLHLSYEGAERVRDRELTSGPRHWRRWIGVLVVVLFLLLVLLLSAFFFPGIYLRRARNNQRGREVPVTASQPALSSDNSVIPKNPAVSADMQPVDRPGFVLQVGAMTHKDNADRLAESLRQKSFPAFVSRRGTDRFYRVMIGPYADSESAFKVKDELRKQDFPAIRMPWNP